MRYVVLLRGINLGPKRRVSMPELRELLSDAGYEDVATYVQSGNVVLSTGQPAAELGARCEALIADRFGLDVPVITRTRSQLAKVVGRDPLGDLVNNPKLYQVTFLAAKPGAGLPAALEEAATASERVVIAGREVYAWHPDGVARSKLWAKLGGKDLGIGATSRNWTTVTKLLEMAGP